MKTGRSRNRRPDRTAPPPPAPARETVARPAAEHWLYGRHAVAAALANPRRRWRRLVVAPGERDAAAALAAAAATRRRGGGEAVRLSERAELAALLPDGAVHQGWALEVEALAAPDLDELLRSEAAAERSVLVVLDQVTDPHNVGAVLRSAAAFGAAAVLVAAHGAAPASGALAKAASGALELVPLVRVVNLARALDRLKDARYWSCGLDENAPRSLHEIDLGPRVALVLGSEGSGLRRLVREHCDYVARLPTRPQMPGLNVSNAAAVALYELSRASATTEAVVRGLAPPISGAPQEGRVKPSHDAG